MLPLNECLVGFGLELPGRVEHLMVEHGLSRDMALASLCAEWRDHLVVMHGVSWSESVRLVTEMSRVAIMDS